MLTNADRSLAHVMVRLLAQGRWLGMLSLVLSALGLWRLAPLAAPSSLAVYSGLFALLLGVFNLYAAIRVALDTNLFADLAADRLTPGQLDSALVLLGLAKEARPRHMADRCRGGLAWLKCLALGTALQFSVVVFIR